MVARFDADGSCRAIYPSLADTATPLHVHKLRYQQPERPPRRKTTTRGRLIAAEVSSAVSPRRMTLLCCVALAVYIAAYGAKGAACRNLWEVKFLCCTVWKHKYNYNSAEVMQYNKR